MLDKAASTIYNIRCDNWGEFMILDLKSVFANEGESLKLNTEFDFSEIDVFGVHPLVSPVKVSGSIYNRAGVVTLDAVLSAEYVAPCDRCCETATTQIVCPVKRILVSRLENAENEEFILLSDMQLDLYELAYTETVLALPTKHLCKEDCRGLCPKCGADLNKGDCGCDRRETDPRLEILKSLL